MKQRETARRLRALGRHCMGIDSVCDGLSVMLIYADIRCLQDPAFARRGIGSHAAFLLGAARGVAHGDVTIIGLSDAALPPPPEAVALLCDTVQSAFAPRCREPGVFLQLSPMTHDSRRVARFFDRPEILPCAVVYDFIPQADPARYLTRRPQLLSYAAALTWLGAARMFLPISVAVGDELPGRLGVAIEDITVTGVALRGPFAAGQLPELRPPQGAPADYVMFVGGADPRKNLDTVVAAIGRLATDGIPPALVVAGGYPPAWQRKVIASASKATGGTARVRFLDHVTDTELAAWYRHSLATVVASRSEGFSMPVIEAMACGSPVIASDIPCHRELVADPAARFHPEHPAALAGLMQRLVHSSSARDQLVAAQRDVPGRFAAARVGERFVSALEARIPRHVQRARRVVARRRPVVALLSPFPPDRSGVADYTLRTVAALAEHADVDVFTDQPAVVSDSHVRAFHPISQAAYLRSDYDTTVAVIGNSHFHTEIIDLHLRHGGPCIIHDSRLADVYAWWHGIPRLRQLAEAELRRQVTEEEIRHWLRHQGELPTLFLSEVVRAGQPVFVHSRGLQRIIRDRYAVDAVHLPFALLRQFTPQQTAAGERLRARTVLGIPPGRIVLVTLGMLGPAKAPEACIDALATVRRYGYDAHLYFVGGGGSDAAPLTDRAVRAGIGGAIHFTGEWLADETYRTWLAAADHGIQLRTHSFGGISGALIDCAAAGLPTVANDDLAMALDAPASVARVPDAFDSGHVAGALLGWLRQGTDAARDEETRQRFCAEHSIESYVERMVSALGLGGNEMSGARRAGCQAAA